MILKLGFVGVCGDNYFLFYRGKSSFWKIQYVPPPPPNQSSYSALNVLSIVSMFLNSLFHISLNVLTFLLIRALTFTVLVRGGLLCCASVTQPNEFETIVSFLSN